MDNKILYELVYSEVFLSHLSMHKKFGQKKSLEKIDSFLDELETHPDTGTGQVEPLRHYKERSIYSRRIDRKHRLVYEIFAEEKKVELLSAFGHYDENQ